MRHKIQSSLILQTFITFGSLVLIFLAIAIIQPQKIFEAQFGHIQIEVISKPAPPPPPPPPPEPEPSDDIASLSSLEDVPQNTVSDEKEELDDDLSKVPFVEPPLDPEVEEALKSGLNFTERHDEKTDSDTLFLAYRVSDDTVIRVSSENNLLIQWLIFIGALLLFAIILVLLLSTVLARFLAKGLSKDISQIDLGILEDKEELAKIVKKYPELNNFVVKLEDQTSRRKQFSSNISHELKSPISALRRQVEVINSELLDSDNIRVQKSLTDINNKCVEINELIDAILNLSQFDENTYTLNITKFNLRRLIQNKIDQYKENYPDRSITFDTTLPDAASEINADKTLINTMLTNIFENGLKYGHEVLNVHLTASDPESGESRIIITASNDGPPIPPEDLPHIFERFYRVDKGRSRAQKGHGIGLSVSKAIVNLHDGDISCTCENGLTMFTVRLGR